MVAVALGAVLHNLQTMAAGDGADRVHIAALAVEMHGQNRFGSRGDGGLDGGGVDVVVFVRFHKDRRCAVDRDAHDAGDVGVGGDDDLVPHADAEQAERDPQRIQPAGQPDAEPRADHGGPLPLKGFDLFAKDVPAAAQHFQRLGLIFSRVQAVLPLEIVCQDLHASASFTCRPFSNAYCVWFCVWFIIPCRAAEW